VQCDELWSFVDHKGNKQWVWLALEADTREIVGVRQFKSEVQHCLKSDYRILQKEYDSQEIFEVYD
jgi:IS1 family transposase